MCIVDAESPPDACCCSPYLSVVLASVVPLDVAAASVWGVDAELGCEVPFVSDVDDVADASAWPRFAVV